MGQKNDVSEKIVQHVMTVTDWEFANLSVTTLAYSFQIDRFKLCRQFKNRRSISLKEFLLREKMGRAALLLTVSPDITVKEISHRIGFSSCDYFIRKFNEYYGLAPGKYRKLKCQYRLRGKMRLKKTHSPGTISTGTNSPQVAIS